MFIQLPENFSILMSNLATKHWNLEILIQIKKNTKKFQMQEYSEKNYMHSKKSTNSF